MSDTGGMAAGRLEAQIAADHAVVEGLFAEMLEATAVATLSGGAAGDGSSSGSDRRDLMAQIVHELSVHAAAEEQVVYPALRDAPGGRGLVDRALDDHQLMKEALVALEHLEPGEPEFQDQFDRLVSAVRAHVPEEEQGLLPKLRTTVGPEKMDDLAEKFEHAKRTAPARPHPLAPNRPPANVIAGAAAAVVDRARDALSHRGEQGANGEHGEG